MNRRSFVVALALAAAPLVSASAHEGHDHKLLGTITEVSAESIVVKATKDGVLSTVALKATTKITRGKSKLAAADLKVGDRVVVNIGNGKAPLIAKAVQVGPAATTR
jgi:hypothetical protein